MIVHVALGKVFGFPVVMITSAERSKWPASKEGSLIFLKAALIKRN
jgi:hypothetical protein